jgi:hypothetical protein
MEDVKRTIYPVAESFPASLERKKMLDAGEGLFARHECCAAGMTIEQTRKMMGGGSRWPGGCSPTWARGSTRTTRTTSRRRRTPAHRWARRRLG